MHAPQHAQRTCPHLPYPERTPPPPPRTLTPSHYHYGYYLYAAAALAKGSPAWAAANRQQLMSLVRDFANPVRADPWFPFARHMDWWGGHSWAGGFNALGDGKNQVGGVQLGWW